MNKAQQASGDTGAEARPARRGPIGRLWWCFQWTLNLTVAAVAVWVFTPAGDWHARKLVRVDPPGQADYIVVLGGGHDGAVEAAALHADGVAPEVIVTSTGEGAETFVRILTAYGVPAGAIRADPNAARTADHPRTVAALPGVDKQADRFCIVTGVLHTSRARACFERAGYRHVAMAAPRWQFAGPLAPAEGAWAHRVQRLPAAIYETVAWAYYRLRGWL